MYTSDNDNNHTPLENGTNEPSKAPAADPSYNPYLQEKATDSSTDNNGNPDSGTETDTNKSSQSAEEEKTASWESAAQEPHDTDGIRSSRCPRCGAALREGAKFCVNCGQSLQKSQTTQNAYSIPGSDSNDSPLKHPYGGSPVPPPEDGYRNPPQHTSFDPTVPEKLSVLDYFVLFLVTNIPVIGLALALYWGFSSQIGINRKNFARAILIMRVIQYVITFLYVLIVVFILNSAGSMGLYGSYGSQSPSIFY